jgi:hypothetical protein
VRFLGRGVRSSTSFAAGRRPRINWRKPTSGDLSGQLAHPFVRGADDSPGDAGGATQMPISGTHAGSPANPADVSQDEIRTRFPRHTHNS